VQKVCLFKQKLPMKKFRITVQNIHIYFKIKFDNAYFLDKNCNKEAAHIDHRLTNTLYFSIKN